MENRDMGGKKKHGRKMGAKKNPRIFFFFNVRKKNMDAQWAHYCQTKIPNSKFDLDPG